MNRNICIIATEIHEDVSNKMIDAAKAVASSLRLKIQKIEWAPGTLEIPLTIKEILEGAVHYDGLVIFGFIQRGKTKHGEIVAHQSTGKILDLQLAYRMPMAVAIIGPDATQDHAFGKASRTAQKAMRVVAKMIDLKAGYGLKKRSPKH